MYRRRRMSKLNYRTGLIHRSPDARLSDTYSPCTELRPTRVLVERKPAFLLILISFRLLVILCLFNWEYIERCVLKDSYASICRCGVSRYIFSEQYSASNPFLQFRLFPICYNQLQCDNQIDFAPSICRFAFSEIGIPNSAVKLEPGRPELRTSISIDSVMIELQYPDTYFPNSIELVFPLICFRVYSICKYYLQRDVQKDYAPSICRVAFSEIGIPNSAVKLDPGRPELRTSVSIDSVMIEVQYWIEFQTLSS